MYIKIQSFLFYFSPQNKAYGWNSDHLSITASILRPHFGHLQHKLTLNNDHLPTKATLFFGFLYTGLAVLQLDKCFLDFLGKNGNI